MKTCKRCGSDDRVRDTRIEITSIDMTFMEPFQIHLCFACRDELRSFYIGSVTPPS